MKRSARPANGASSARFLVTLIAKSLRVSSREHVTSRSRVDRGPAAHRLPGPSTPLLGEQPHQDEVLESAVPEDCLSLSPLLHEPQLPIEGQRRRVRGQRDERQPVQAAVVEQVAKEVREQFSGIALAAHAENAAWNPASP